MKLKLMPVVMMFMFTLGAAALANDAATEGEGGTVRIIRDKEHPYIQMVREWVRMDVYAKYYDVRAQFVFRNHGPASTVKMCFPEGYDGDVDENKLKTISGFEWFRTWVDGRRVSAKRIFYGYVEASCWIKKVRFPARGVRVVRVAYRSPLGRRGMSGNFAEYLFSGGNWAGKVEDSRLEIYMRIPGTTVIGDDDGYDILHDMGLTHRGNRLSGHWRNWEAQNLALVDFHSTTKGAFQLSDDAEQEVAGAGFLIDNPGDNPNLDWPPANELSGEPASIISRNGKLFISLSGLADYLDGILPKTDKVIKKYDSGTRTATLAAFGKEVAFSAGKKTMAINGGKPAPLAVAPFLMNFHYVNFDETEMRTYFYVPLKPVVAALGGSVSVDYGTRKVVLGFPVTGGDVKDDKK